MVKKIFLLFSFSILVSCSIGSRKDQESFRLMLNQREYEQALDFLEKSSLREDEKNNLLYLMEKAQVLYYKKRYLKASFVFIKANELVDKLYTKSIKEAIASGILNDNSKSFYGNIFERSQLYQMQAMTFYKMAVRGFVYDEKVIDGKKIEVKRELTSQEISRNLDRVRSTLIAWDSFFQEMSRQTGYKTFLKHDLLAKNMAAQLHQSLGTRRDLEIALQLYRDAFKILNTFAATQKIFNESYQDYNKKLKSHFDGEIKKPSLAEQKLTKEFYELKDYITFKILSLTKRVRRSKYQSWLRKLAPTDKVKNKLKRGQQNVSFIISNGLISKLKGKTFSYNLRSAIDNMEDSNTKAVIRGIGVPVLTYFALGPLGLGTVSRHGNVTVYGRHNVGEKLTEEVGIEFELPYAEPSQSDRYYKLAFYQGDKEVSSVELSTLSSLSDYAFISSQEVISNSFMKRAIRVGAKYAAAIVAAYSTYKSIKDQNGELFAKPAAMAQFLLSQKAIKESEKADVRYWSSLPSEYLATDVRLKNGKYQVFFVEYSKEKAQQLRRVQISKLEIKSQKKKLFSYHLF